MAAAALLIALFGLCSVGCDEENTNSGQSMANNAAPDAGGDADDRSDADQGGDVADDVSGDIADEEVASCEEGELSCLSESEVGRCEGGELQTVETCPEEQFCSSGRCTNRESCEPGTVDGCWDDTARRVCNEEGTGFVAAACEEGLSCLRGECTDAVCVPGTQHCADRRILEVCNEDGTGYVDQQDCPEGSVCVDGTCLSGCELSEKFPSYLGCQYWSLDLDNYPDPFGDPAAVPHAVVVSNPSSQEAVVSITTMADVQLEADSFTVPPGGVEVYTFPRLDVDGTGITNHSFFLESSWPVVAHQFNPLNNVGVASNDASLLLPAETLGTDYIALSWPTTPIPEQFELPPQHGYVTIVATSAGTTEVTLTPAADVQSGSNVPFLPEGEEQVFSLRQYQVLNIEADGTELAVKDLTGTTISADQPIAVFGGHEEAVVGEGCCAEHLEQQMLPVNTWGRRYLAVKSEERGGSVDVWRVIASEDNTQVETIPPQPESGTFTLNRGEFHEITTDASFEIVADKPIMVGQYLVSQEDTASVTGDPALIVAVPLSQFRSDYTVLTPQDYTENWFTIMRPVGEEITIDGQVVSDREFRSFGSGDYEWAWIQVEEGAHTVEAEAPFGLTAYGFSSAVSYGYPGGLNLLVE